MSDWSCIGDSNLMGRAPVSERFGAFVEDRQIGGVGEEPIAPAFGDLEDNVKLNPGVRRLGGRGKAESTGRFDLTDAF